MFPLSISKPSNFSVMFQQKGLETILEFPLPAQRNTVMKSRTRSLSSSSRSTNLHVGWCLELETILACIATPLPPFPLPSDEIIDCRIENHCNIGGVFKKVRSFFSNVKARASVVEELSDAKYIARQYIASAGGYATIYGTKAMFAMGRVKTEVLICKDERDKEIVMSMCRQSGGDLGAFVFWMKRPDLCSLELVVNKKKILAGCDGRTTWRHTYPKDTKGPLSLLRPFLQGLDPRSIANLFMNSIYIGDEVIDGEACFILEVQAEPSTLRARSCDKVHIIRHTMQGFFSQKSGLLTKLEETHLLHVKISDTKYISLNTGIKTQIEDYRFVDGVNIAHGGRTFASLVETGKDCNSSSSRVEMEEVWKIKEVGFNMEGLHKEIFLPPSEPKNEKQEGGERSE